VTFRPFCRVASFLLDAERKAPLVGQLLAVADEFCETGHRRAALTEAVSALEIAVSQFAQRANPESWSTQLAGRSSAEQFHNHVQHLGTSIPEDGSEDFSMR
jgi:hypothetical protein